MKITPLSMNDSSRRSAKELIRMSDVPMQGQARILEVAMLPGSLSEWSKPYLHLTMAIKDLIPEYILPYGIEEFSVGGDNGILSHGYYSFSRAQLVDMVEKGLFTSDFQEPFDLIGADWSVPMKADVAIRPPKMDGRRYDLPIAYLDIKGAASLDLTAENTGVDLVEYFKDVAEYENEAQSASLTEVKDAQKIVQDEYTAGPSKQLEEGDNLFDIDYDKMQAEEEAEAEKPGYEHENLMDKDTGLNIEFEEEEEVQKEDTPEETYESVMESGLDLDFDSEYDKALSDADVQAEQVADETVESLMEEDKQVTEDYERRLAEAQDDKKKRDRLIQEHLRNQEDEGTKTRVAEEEFEEAAEGVEAEAEEQKAEAQADDLDLDLNLDDELIFGPENPRGDLSDEEIFGPSEEKSEVEDLDFDPEEEREADGDLAPEPVALEDEEEKRLTAVDEFLGSLKVNQDDKKSDKDTQYEPDF